MVANLARFVTMERGRRRESAKSRQLRVNLLTMSVERQRARKAATLTSSEPNGLRDALRVLRPGPFRRYMAGEAVSSTGTWMQMMAQSWVMTTLTHSALMLGMVNFAAGIPQLLLTMTGGSVADRHEKRNILLVSQLVQIGLALTAGYLVMTHRIQMWHLLVMSVALGIQNAFEMPAASALVPELVSPDEIASAIAVDRSSFHATRLIGPAIAGLCIGAWGAASAFYANALSFVALIIALMTLKPRPLGTPEEEEKRSGGMKDGWNFVRSDKPTLAMIALMAMTTVFVFPVMTILLPLYTRDELGLPASGLGVLMALHGLGSLTGSILLLRVPRAKRMTVMAFAVLGIVLALATLALTHQVLVAVAALVSMTVCLSTMFGLSNTTVQERAPDHLRGRVSAIAGLSFFGLMPFAGLVITSVSDAVGMRTALGAAASIFALGGGFMVVGPGRRATQTPDELRVPIEAT